MLDAGIVIFRSLDFSGVRTEGAQPGGNGPGTEDGAYWRESVSIPFTFDEQG